MRLAVWNRSPKLVRGGGGPLGSLPKTNKRIAPKNNTHTHFLSGLARKSKHVACLQNKIVQAEEVTKVQELEV